jgi:uncharacterized protein (DUF1778 family)
MMGDAHNPETVQGRSMHMTSAALCEEPQVMADKPSRREDNRQKRDTVINVRVPRLLRDLIDSAADAVGTTRSDFILDSARKHAIDVLLDQRLFVLDPKQFDAFLSALDEPPSSTDKLKRLMASKAPWEK